MITHHPKHELIQAFVAGDLPASLSIGVAAHVEMCNQCGELVQKMTQKLASETFELINDNFDDKTSDDFFLEMMNDITQDNSQTQVIDFEPPSIILNEKIITLPRAFNQFPLKNWSKFGDISRSRLDLNEEPLRSSLLNIDPQGEVPMHTHKGFELTLILDGSFSDDMGTYEVGDFMWLDNQHTHSPATSEGCLCYTVSDNAQKFTQGLSKLLNPIGSLLY
jgi:putative transcriptional regulator